MNKKAPPPSAVAEGPRRFLDERSTAETLNVSARTLQRWRQDGGGPPYIRAGARRVLYDRDALAEWAVSRTYAHRAAELAREDGA